MAHPSEQTINRYAHGTLTSEEQREVDAHLAGCETCQAAVHKSERLLTMERNWQQELQHEVEEEEAHPLPEEIAAAILGSGTPLSREIIEDHLQVCRKCAAVARDLRQFQRNAEAYRSLSPVVPERQTESEQKNPWRFPMIRFATPALAFAVVVALLFMVRFQQELHTMHQRNERLTMRVHTLDSDVRKYADVSAALARTEAQRLRAEKETQRLRAENQTLQRSAHANLINTTAEALVQAFRKKGLQVLPLPGSQATETHYASGETRREIKPLLPTHAFVLEPQPQFAWQPVPGKQIRYQVVLARNNKIVAQSPPLTTPLWTSSVELEAGVVYVWQVRATEASGTEPVAISRSLYVERVDSSALQADLLSAALRYAQLRQWAEARASIQSVLKIAPHNPDAHRLLATLQHLEKDSSKIAQ